MTDDDLAQRLRDAARSASSRVFWQPVRTPAETLRALADACDDLGLDRFDLYGGQGPVGQLETEVAELLGLPDAVLFPSGVMAQQAALRSWCDRSGTRRVAMPDLSHLLVHEEDGPRRVLGLEIEHLTRGRALPTPESLAAVPGRLGAVLVELPLRDAGCLLPTWDELTAFSEACRERGVPLHVDGARIWEASASWDRPLSDVGPLVDSVYVSLYKGLGGLAGALVAGPEDLTAELRLWRRRLGGTLYRMTPEAVGGLVGLREELPRMGDYLAWARALAVALQERGLRTVPEVPHISTFEVYAAGDAASVNERLATLAEDEGLLLGPPWRPTDVPGQVTCELAVYSVALDHDPAEVAERLAALVAS